MKRMLNLGLLAAGLLWAASAMAAAQGAPIEDPLRVDFPPAAGLTDAAVGERIKLAAAARSWRVEAETPGRIGLATIFNNKHSVRVEIEYTGAGYTLRYVESGNLRYRPELRTIHPSYNRWMREFCLAINAALGVSAMVTVPLTVPAAPAAFATVFAAGAAAVPVAAAVAVPAAEGLPASGSKWKYGYRDRQYDRREQFFTIEVAGVEQTRVRERMAVGGAVSEAVIDADKLAFATRRVSASTAMVELTPYLRDLQNRPTQQPAGYPASNSAAWQVSAPEYIEEEVRVPAGSFKALRVEVRGTSEAFGGAFSPTATARFVYVAWYSREINRYVRIHHQTWDRQNGRIGDEHVQLVEYQPGKQSIRRE